MPVHLKFTRLIEDKNVKKIELSKALGIARNTLDDYLCGRTSMNVATLEKIAVYFNVPVTYFFDETPMQNNTGAGYIVSGNNSSANGGINLSLCQQEVETLKARLKDKEEIITLLREKLKKQNKK